MASAALFFHTRKKGNAMRSCLLVSRSVKTLLFMGLLLLPTSVMSQATLTAGSVSGSPGSVVELPITLDASEIDCSGSSFGLAHDDEVLELVGITEGADLLDVNDGAGPGYFFMNLDPTGGPGGYAAFITYDLDLDTLETLPAEDDLEVVIYEYEVSDDAEAGESVDIEFTEELAANPTAPLVAIEVVDGIFGTELTLEDGDVSVVSGILSIVESGILEGGGFLRGDVDGSGDVAALVDALALLEYGFENGSEPGCFDSADVDDDGEVFVLLDAVALLTWGFVGGTSPPDPGPEECGDDPTNDDLGCATTSESCDTP